MAAILNSKMAVILKYATSAKLKHPNENTSNTCPEPRCYVVTRVHTGLWNKYPYKNMVKMAAILKSKMAAVKVTWKFGNIGFCIPWCLDFYTWKLQRLYPKKHMDSRACQTNTRQCLQSCNAVFPALRHSIVIISASLSISIASGALMVENIRLDHLSVGP